MEENASEHRLWPRGCQFELLYLVSWEKDQPGGKFSLPTLLTPQEALGLCRRDGYHSCSFFCGPHIQQ